MLNGGGGLNADGLALDLQFAADKTLPARKGPTPVFTRGSTGTFVGSNGLIQSAAVNAARFDHDPVTLASRGLLIEEGRTNLALRSEDFGNATWTKSNATISGTLYTAPTGASTANELVEDSLSAAHTCIQSAAIATIGTTYTFSVFVKRKPSSNQFLLIGATNLVTASFISVNLTNGVTATGIGSPAVPINVSSTTYPDGWYRVQFSVVATSAAASIIDIRLSRDGTWANRYYLGDGVQSSLVWGAQVEAGSFATSYIPTTTVILTRGADVCSITGAAFTGMYNAIEGAFLSNSSQPFITVANAIVYAADNGADNERFNLRHQTSLAVSQLGGATQSLIDLSDPTANAVSKIAYAYANANYGAARNGTFGASFPNLAVPTVNRIFIGSKGHNSSEYLNGHIASIRYYKKRLPNAKLQALTV